VTDRGAGRPLVLIPGWTFGAAVFDRNVERLARSTRDHGTNDAVTAPATRTHATTNSTATSAVERVPPS
jgi:hypothetical protein